MSLSHRHKDQVENINSQLAMGSEIQNKTVSFTFAIVNQILFRKLEAALQMPSNQSINQPSSPISNMAVWYVGPRKYSKFLFHVITPTSVITFPTTLIIPTNEIECLGVYTSGMYVIFHKILEWEEHFYIKIISKERKGRYCPTRQLSSALVN